MKFSVSIKKNHEFRRLYSKGKSAANPWVVVYCRKNGRGYNQLGITVSTKIGKAVVRNRIRRRLREIYRLDEAGLKKGLDIVIVARMRCRGSQYRELEHAVRKAFAKLGLYASPEGQVRSL